MKLKEEYMVRIKGELVSTHQEQTLESAERAVLAFGILRRSERFRVWNSSSVPQGRLINLQSTQGHFKSGPPIDPHLHTPVTNLPKTSLTPKPLNPKP